MHELNIDFLSGDNSTSNLELVINTEGLTDHERVEFWHDIGSKVYVAHQPHIEDAKNFRVEAKFATSGNYEISLGQMQGAQLERNLIHTRQDDSERCFLAMLLEGDTSFTQDDVILRPKPGEIFLIDTSKPYHISHNSKSRLLHIMVQREEIERRMGNTRRYIGRSTDPGNPLGNIAAFLMHKAAFSLSHSDNAYESQIMDTMVEMTSQALSHVAGQDEGNLLSSSDLILSRLEAAIQQQFRNPYLSSATLASSAGVSIRHANRLLAERDTSLMRWVQEVRLQYAARMLANPKMDMHLITKIAFASGFSDTPHFSRTFHRRFGMSPRDYRTMSQNNRR